MPRNTLRNGCGALTNCFFLSSCGTVPWVLTNSGFLEVPRHSAFLDFRTFLHIHCGTLLLALNLGGHSMTGSNSTTFAAHVPTITVLRDLLQYGDGRLARCNAFNDTMLVFRKNYVTSTGLRGSEIHDWKSAEHQAALTEMSQAFLDRDGNGELYWPIDPTSPNFNNLQYSNQQSL